MKTASFRTLLASISLVLLLDAPDLVWMEGIVREGESPVAGARLVATPLGDDSISSGASVVTYSDEDGWYMFDRLRPGRWYVSILPPTGAVQMAHWRLGVVRPWPDVVLTHHFEIDVPDVAEFEHDYSWPLTVVGGTFLDGPEGEPIPALHLRLERTVDPEAGCAGTSPIDLVTDRNGRFQVRGLEPGRYHMTAGGAVDGAEGANRRRMETDLLVQAGVIADDLSFRIPEEGAVLEGRIVDETGRPPGEARVHLFAADGEEMTDPDGIPTRPDGTYRVVGLDPGTHLLAIAWRKEGWGRNTGPFIAEEVALDVGQGMVRDDRLQPAVEVAVNVYWTQVDGEDSAPTVSLLGPSGVVLDGLFGVSWLGVEVVRGGAHSDKPPGYPRFRATMDSYSVQPGVYEILTVKGDRKERRRVEVGERGIMLEIDLRR